MDVYTHTLEHNTYTTTSKSALYSVEETQKVKLYLRDNRRSLIFLPENLNLRESWNRQDHKIVSKVNIKNSSNYVLAVENLKRCKDTKDISTYPRLAFTIADVKKAMEDVKQKVEASSPPPNGSNKNSVTNFIWSSLKSQFGHVLGIAAGGLGTAFLGRTKTIISGQQASSQPTVAGNVLGTVAGVAGGATVMNNALIRNYVQVAANEQLLPFFRTYPSHFVTLGVGLVAGLTTSEFVLENAGRLLISRCPVLNISEHLQTQLKTLEELHDCLEVKGNHTEIVNIRDKRIEHLSKNITTLGQDLERAFHNATNLVEKLEGCTSKQAPTEEELKQCKKDLNICSKSLSTASVRADRRLIVPTFLDDQGLSTTYKSHHPWQTPTDHKTLYDDVFFIRGSCLFGVTVVHMESGLDYYYGRALCRTPSDVVSLTSLLVAAFMLIQSFYTGYVWYRNGLVRHADRERVMGLLQQELARYRPHYNLPPAN
jgi:hypothetical protein